MLVHTSSSRVSIPIWASLFRKEVVDSLLVLLQKRKGNGEARRRRIASGELAMVWVAVWRMVPERSMSNALMAGRWVMIPRNAKGTARRAEQRYFLSYLSDGEGLVADCGTKESSAAAWRFEE